MDILKKANCSLARRANKRKKTGTRRAFGTRRRAFSLVEMIIVVSMLSVLSGAVVVSSWKTGGRDMTFSGELDAAAERIAVAIYKELYRENPSGRQELVDAGLLVQVE